VRAPTTIVALIDVSVAIAIAIAVTMPAASPKASPMTSAAGVVLAASPSMPSPRQSAQLASK
jgi:hypothetical protein